MNQDTRLDNRIIDLRVSSCQGIVLNIGWLSWVKVSETECLIPVPISVVCVVVAVYRLRPIKLYFGLKLQFVVFSETTSLLKDLWRFTLPRLFLVIWENFFYFFCLQKTILMLSSHFMLFNNFTSPFAHWARLRNANPNYKIGYVAYNFNSNELCIAIVQVLDH